MPPTRGPGLNRLYSKLWRTKGSLSTYTTNPDLRLSLLVAMADALGVDRLSFLETILEEYRRSGHLPPPPRRSEPLLVTPLSPKMPVPKESGSE
jgi:hypothetical protein